MVFRCKEQVKAKRILQQSSGDVATFTNHMTNFLLRYTFTFSLILSYLFFFVCLSGA